MRIRVWAIIFVFAALLASAHAEAALLLEESLGSRYGDLTPTGHSAIYLTGVCAASPTRLRRCEPGEPGVVLGRYHGLGGYDWIAIPLLPYLYAVENMRDIPSFADSHAVGVLRETYRRNHLQWLVPEAGDGAEPTMPWWRLVGSAYDRRIYGFSIATSSQQDDALIERFNAQGNKSHFNLLFHNCADFSRAVLNDYYPHAVHRDLLADAGITTPKQVARSLAAYGRKHPELRYSSFVIPQAPGNLPRSRHLQGVLEAVLKTKKFVLPLALLHPAFTGVLAATYLTEGRFNPRRNAVVFDVARAVQPAAAPATPSMAANSASATRINAPANSKRLE